MSHSIYTGSFAELEARWMEVVAELQQGDPLFEINILAGSNILASYLKRRLAVAGRTVGNVRFHTFSDLLSRLAHASAFEIRKPYCPRLGPSILLEDILKEHSPAIYASVSGYRGFRDALLDTFRDLRDAGFSPEELGRAIQLDAGSPDRQPHLVGFAELYRRFRERVSLFHDVDDDFRLAIRNASDSRFVGFKNLMIYGIYDATGLQSRMLATLENSLEMIYFIPFVDEGISEFARVFLENRAKELGVQPIRLQAKAPANSLGSLAARGFGFSAESRNRGPIAADGSFAIVSAPGESRAALEIVREIFRAIHDRTISGFHEAAIILRQPESGVPILTELLRLHGVPYFIQGGGRFAERPLSKAVRALSELEANSFTRDAILNAMELVAASLPESLQIAWDVPSWRALTNDPRFLTGVRSWDEGTSSIIEQARRELHKAETPSIDFDEDEINARSIDSVRAKNEQAQHLRDAWRLLRRAAADWPVQLSWQDWALLLAQRFEELLSSSSDWPFFSTVLDEISSLQALARFYKTDAVSVDRLKSALVESIESLSYPVGRFQRSGVNILSTSAAPGLQFPLVIIPGLDEGRFPAKLRQDPLLLDSERWRMGGLPIKSKRMDEETLLFDMAARSAEKRLVLMTSRLEESSDRERLPSQFLLRVAAGIQGRAVTIRDLTQETFPGFRSVSLDNPAPAKHEIPVNEGEIRLRQITAGRKSAPAVLAVLAEFDADRLKRPLAYDRARWINKLTEFDGLISDPKLVQWTAQKFGASSGQVSASRIEEYVKCPYYYFLKRVMNLEAWEEQGKVEGMDPLERGVAVHSILEGFLKNSGDAIFQARSAEDLRSLLAQTAHHDLDDARPAGMPDLLWEVQRDSLISLLAEWLEFEIKRSNEGIRIARLEQSFGTFASSETCPPFRVKAGRHTFDFRGRIDRIDVSIDGKHARVIDYKTGALPDSMANPKIRTPLMSGERIQIAVYRGALAVLSEFGALESIEGEYLHLQPKDGRIVACSFSDEQLQKASQNLPGILEIAGDGFEKGIFFARTHGVLRPNGHCDYCDYLSICGKDRVQREERKAVDPAVRRFLGVLEPMQ
jgi:ATP-dependent helicase/nuclease subunit B